MFFHSSFATRSIEELVPSALQKRHGRPDDANAKSALATLARESADNRMRMASATLRYMEYDSFGRNSDGVAIKELKAGLSWFAGSTDGDQYALRNRLLAIAAQVKAAGGELQMGGSGAKGRGSSGVDVLIDQLRSSRDGRSNIETLRALQRLIIDRGSNKQEVVDAGGIAVLCRLLSGVRGFLGSTGVPAVQGLFHAVQLQNDYTLLAQILGSLAKDSASVQRAIVAEGAIAHLVTLFDAYPGGPEGSCWGGSSVVHTVLRALSSLHQAEVASTFVALPHLGDMYGWKLKHICDALGASKAGSKHELACRIRGLGRKAASSRDCGAPPAVTGHGQGTGPLGAWRQQWRAPDGTTSGQTWGQTWNTGGDLVSRQAARDFSSAPTPRPTAMAPNYAPMPRPTVQVPPHERSSDAGSSTVRVSIAGAKRPRESAGFVEIDGQLVELFD